MNRKIFFLVILFPVSFVMDCKYISEEIRKFNFLMIELNYVKGVVFLKMCSNNMKIYQ